MVRLALSMCVQDLKCPADVYADETKKRLLLKEGVPLTERAKGLLQKSGVDHIEFPLPFESSDPPPYTFSEKTEGALFEIARDTYQNFKGKTNVNPLEIRKQVYEILSQASAEFEAHCRLEHPVLDTPPRRSPRSVLHLRTVGRLQDYLCEHAKNTSLTCLVLAYDFFNASNQLLAEIHKVAVAGLFADLGMTLLPKHILQGESELTDKDWEAVHRHPDASSRFVESMFRQENFVTATLVMQHHERNDGTGYPEKLRRPKLEPHARLLAAADSYQSMVSKRYFREASDPTDAILTLNQEAAKDKRYDQDAVRSLNSRIAPYPVGTVARFADNKLIQVLALTNTPTEFEKVRLLPDASKERLYNVPMVVRSFTTKKPVESQKKVKITGHLEKIGARLDTFDLLALYGYTAEP